MIINRHYRALELDKVLQLLSREASCSESQERILSMEPSTGLYEVKLLLQETDDAHMLTGRFGSPSFGGLQNVANSLRRAQAGASLSMGELLKVAEVLRVMRGLTQWRKRSEGLETSIDWRFEALTPNKYLEEKIASSILSEEEMADGASQALGDIRRKINAASLRVREKLDHMIHSPAYQKYLQEPIVTLRGGRFVVPVKAECRGEVPGLVHDTSGSGATVFVEPMAVVEANNDIKVLKSKEEAEIERILYELSQEAGGFADSIIEGYNAAIELDILFAKAKLAYRMKATLPEVNDQGKIYLKKARHPLIDPKAVVATDIELGLQFDTLVITGPNTGGKTVSLKTIGLLTLMAMCGLLLPASNGSMVSVFSQVLADIGDEQSIEQSLSTFSAHMTNMIHILSYVEREGISLVLIDELGAGTDPVEGAALAMAILETLRASQVRIAATTHYAELKAYALQTAGVENGCCEFDVATLRPTYRLLIGVPGRSNAFAISERLGMDQHIVARARELVSAENSRFEDVVRNLEESRQSLEQERKEAQELSAQAQQYRQEAEQRAEKLRRDSEAELEKARVEARNLVARARAQAQALMDELDDLRKKNREIDAQAKARLKAGIREMENTADPVKEKQGEDYRLPRALQAGDSVLIYDLDKKAVVLEPADSSGNVLVQAGIIKTRVPVGNLRLLKQEKVQKPKGRGVRTVKTRASAPVQQEVDLRGMTVEEGIMELDNFIDSALLSGITLLTVIHGKGTGVLRKAVQERLKRHPSVKSYRLGNYGEGEAGVTIVELK